MQLFLIVITIPLTALSAVTRERLTAQDELRRSQKRLQLTLDAAQMGTWEWQIATDRSIMSDKMKIMFALDGTHRDFTLDQFLQLLSPEDRDEVAAAVERTVREGTPYESEFRITLPDGTMRWVHAKGVALFDETGRPARLLGVNADVTERKLAYAAVSELKSRYEAAIRASNQLLYDWDPHTNDVTYGGDIQLILGYSREEMQGGLQAFVDKLHPEDREAFELEIARVLDTEDSFGLTYRCYRKDGRVIWL